MNDTYLDETEKIIACKEKQVVNIISLFDAEWKEEESQWQNGLY